MTEFDARVRGLRSLQRLRRYRLPDGAEVVADLLFRRGADGTEPAIGWVLHAVEGWYEVHADGSIEHWTHDGAHPVRFDASALVSLGPKTRCRGTCAWGYEPVCPEGKDA